MANGMSWFDVKALETLLTPAGSSKEDRSLCSKAKNATNPSAIGSQKSKNKENAEAQKTEEHTDPDFEFGDRYGRTQPEYDIIYKQDVSPSDVYLQMSEKNPSSLCCNVMVLRVKLPQTESVSDIKLDVQPTYVKLKSNLYFLALYLPHLVKHDRSNAKWEVAKETLVISMPIEREY